MPSLPQGTPEIRLSDEMPSIKRLPDPPIEYQLKKLEESSMELVQLFPTIQEMKRRVRASRYPGKPYTCGKESVPV